MAFNSAAITFGQFVASIVDGLFSTVDYPHGWRYMLGLGAVPALIQLVGFLFLPESPRWLAKYGHDDAARAVLQQIRGPSANIEAELSRITTSIKDEAAISTTAPTLQSAMADPGLSRAIVLGASLQAFQQLSGINTVMPAVGETVILMTPPVYPC